MVAPWINMSDFFFQAGDGIRDDLVTGVQTCALPIFGEVRLVDFRIDFDFVDRKSLLVFRAGAALINFEGELHSLDFAVIGEDALPGKRLVSDLASPFPFGRQERGAVDEIRADFPALAGYLQTINCLAV